MSRVVQTLRPSNLRLTTRVAGHQRLLWKPVACRRPQSDAKCLNPTTGPSFGVRSPGRTVEGVKFNALCGKATYSGGCRRDVRLEQTRRRVDRRRHNPVLMSGSTTRTV